MIYRINGALSFREGISTVSAIIISRSQDVTPHRITHRIFFVWFNLIEDKPNMDNNQCEYTPSFGINIRRIKVLTKWYNLCRCLHYTTHCFGGFKINPKRQLGFVEDCLAFYLSQSNPPVNVWKTYVVYECSRNQCYVHWTMIITAVIKEITRTQIIHGVYDTIK